MILIGSVTRKVIGGIVSTRPAIIRSTLSGIVFAAVACISSNTFAQEAEFEAFIVDMPFSSVVDTLRRDLGVQFVGERYRRRRVSDLKLSGSREEVIDALMKHARMDAFLFNGQVYYAPLEDRAVRLVPLDENLSAERAFEALDAAGLLIPGFDVSEVSNGGALVMSGPVRYLAISEGVLAAFAVPPDVVGEPVRVRRAGVIDARPDQVSVSPTSTNQKRGLN